MRPTQRIRRIRIQSGELKLDFKASAEQAEHVADELGRSSADFHVLVDDNVGDDLRPLPCARLWE